MAYTHPCNAKDTAGFDAVVAIACPLALACGREVGEWVFNAG